MPQLPNRFFSIYDARAWRHRHSQVLSNFRPPDIVHVLRYISYQHHNIDEPAFMLGIALP